MAKRGAPPEYNARIHPKVASILTRQGKTKAEVAEILGIHRTTLFDWQKTHIEFADALRASAHEADAQVEAALFQRALGYEYDEIKVIDDGGRRRIEKTRKAVAPDVTAAQWWLKNRMSERWRDQVEPPAKEEETGLLADFLEVIEAVKSQALPSIQEDAPAGEEAPDGKAAG